MKRIMQWAVIAAVLFASMFPVVAFGLDSVFAEQAYAVSATRNVETGQDDRYGSGDSYVGIDPGKLFSEDGSSDNSLLTGAINIIDFAVSYVMLPLGILWMMWRTVYLAIFPMMAQMDPLDLLHNGRYKNVNNPVLKGSMMNAGNMQSMNQAISGNTRAILDNMSVSKNLKDNTPITSLNKDFYDGVYFDNPGGSMVELAKKAIIIELRFLGLGLVVVFITFGLIKLLMRFAIIFLSTSTSAAGMM